MDGVYIEKNEWEINENQKGLTFQICLRFFSFFFFFFPFFMQLIKIKPQNRVPKSRETVPSLSLTTMLC